MVVGVKQYFSYVSCYISKELDGNVVSSFRLLDPHLLLLALDWAKFGLTVGSREQTAFLLVLVLYVLCWVVTMVAAREKPHRIERCYGPWTGLEYFDRIPQVGKEQ